MALEDSTGLSPPPESLTEGDLILRRWLPSDAEALNQAVLSSIADISRWMLWAADGYDLQKAQSFISFATKSWDEGEEFNYAVLVDGQPAGSFGIMRPVTKASDTLEIGYWLGAAALGRGLATRATHVLTRAAFDMGVGHVQIRHDPANQRSAAIPRRLGFTYIGVSELPTGPAGEVVPCGIWQKDQSTE